MIYAIADLHLSFGTPNKKMDLFGPAWENHPDKIAAHWKSLIQPDDLVLIAGDISWAKRDTEAKPDFDWIESLPGTKVLIKGNHDYWWESLSKIKKIIPPSCHLIQNNSFRWNDAIIVGSRLWDTQEIKINPNLFPDFPGKYKEKTKEMLDDQERLFEREVERLKLSLESMDRDVPIKICMTHYPPISDDLQENRITQLLNQYGIQHVVFGHLHNIDKECPIFGKASNGIHYHLTAADYLNFVPKRII